MLGAAGSDFKARWARPGAGGGAGGRAMLAALCGLFPGKEKPAGLGRARWGWADLSGGALYPQPALVAPEAIGGASR